MTREQDAARSARQVLEGLRVLEVADWVAGPYCGKLLASLGAEVVKVEAPPAGDSSRRRGPFPGDVPHPERSGLFLYLNTGKRGITLNLDDPEGRRLLYELAQTVDVIVHDRQPARARATGLDPEALAQANPRLVVAAVTPYGSSGPYADYHAYDINVFHAGGEGYLLPNGLALEAFADRAPLVAGSFMGSFQGGVTAALGILSAVLNRDEDASGQMIDCSLQEAQLAIGYLPVQRLEAEGVVETRFSRYFRLGGTLPARDGYVELLTIEPRQWEGLVEFLGQPDWATSEVFQDPASAGPEFNRRLREWTSERTREWLYHQGQAHGVPIGPYYTPGEVFDNPQHRERGCFIPVGHPEAGTLDQFGLPFRLAATPGVITRAPLLGEHNREVFGALGYSPEDLVALARAEAI